MPMRFWYWWTVTILGVFAAGMGEYFFSISSIILEYDQTYISLLIISIAFIFTIAVGWNWRYMNNGVPDIYWYTAEAVIALGMIGTIIGFMIVLSQTFIDIDVSDTDDVKELISTMAGGMGTALITTLAGLVSSTWMKIQLVIVNDRAS